MKIGLLGGSFNPAHFGHIHISLATKKQLGLKQIWLIPAKQNPFKIGNPSSIENRIKDCVLITKEYPQILVKDFEAKMMAKDRTIYSIDLLKRIIVKYPNHHFLWLMGADSILHFHKWKQWKKIIKAVPLVVINRDNFFYKAVKSKAFLYAKKQQRIQFLTIKKSAESSTKIRNNHGK